MSQMPPGFRIYIDNAAKLSRKTEAEMLAVLSKSGLKKHGELREHAMEMMGLGHGHANALAALYLKPEWQTGVPKPKPGKTPAPPPAPKPSAKPVAKAAAPAKPAAKVAAKPVAKKPATKPAVKKAAPKKKK